MLAAGLILSFHPATDDSKGACQMSQPAVSKSGEQTPVTTSTSATPATRDRLATGDGQISVAEGVVQKIAGKACREIGGVHAMGTGGTRAFGAIRERIPGSSGPNVAQGGGGEAGERMTGLGVGEVNIAVDDVFLPSTDDDQDTTSRVS